MTGHKGAATIGAGWRADIMRQSLASCAAIYSCNYSRDIRVCTEAIQRERGRSLYTESPTASGFHRRDQAHAILFSSLEGVRCI